MSRRFCTAALLAAGFAGFLGTAPALATPTFYNGCFNCEAFGNGQSECVQVGDDETGEGWRCKEEEIFGGLACVTNHEACYNMVTTSGGGGPGGGSQGSECNIGSGSYCPPSCGACNRTP